MEGGNYAGGANCVWWAMVVSGSNTKDGEEQGERIGETGDEENGERGERKGTREFLQINAVHSLDEPCLVEREDFVTDGEQRHLTRF